MAFNLSTFKTRALTSAVFAIIMITGLLWNGWSFILLFTIIHFGCWYEFIKLMKKINPLRYKFLLPFGLIYITLPLLLMIDAGFNGSIFTNDHTYAVTNNFYYVYIIPCGIVFSIWVNDTMAYIVGSLIGKTPFSKISPRKTWEGTIGGILLSVLIVGFLIAPILYGRPVSNISQSLNNNHWFTIAGIAAVFGTIGDLFESKLKRLAKVKDSGTVMPGHGGFLDRFDSLLVATPLVWIYIHFFAHS